MSGTLMSGTLLLGPVQFAAFELPERIIFGGSQLLSVHQLLGGLRVIDAMGPDDTDVTWGGIFSGSDAALRARLLDTLRATGAPLPLIWDGFFYTVVIRSFLAEYQNPHWLPYRISCAVLRDEARAVIAAAVNLASSALTDLATAASAGFDTSTAQTALAASGSTALGTVPYAQAQSAIAQGQSGIEAGLTSAAGNLGSSDFPTVLAAVQQLAGLAVARGYVARAGVNLTNASP